MEYYTSAFCLHTGIIIIFFPWKNMHHLVLCPYEKQHQTNWLASQEHIKHLCNFTPCKSAAHTLTYLWIDSPERNTIHKTAQPQGKGGAVEADFDAELRVALAVMGPSTCQEGGIKPSREWATFHIPQYNSPSVCQPSRHCKKKH